MPPILFFRNLPSQQVLLIHGQWRSDYLLAVRFNLFLRLRVSPMIFASLHGTFFWQYAINIPNHYKPLGFFCGWKSQATSNDQLSELSLMFPSAPHIKALWPLEHPVNIGQRHNMMFTWTANMHDNRVAPTIFWKRVLWYWNLNMSMSTMGKGNGYYKPEMLLHLWSSAQKIPCSLYISHIISSVECRMNNEISILVKEREVSKRHVNAETLDLWSLQQTLSLFKKHAIVVAFSSWEPFMNKLPTTAKSECSNTLKHPMRYTGRSRQWVLTSSVFIHFRPGLHT